MPKIGTPKKVFCMGSVDDGAAELYWAASDSQPNRAHLQVHRPADGLVYCTCDGYYYNEGACWHVTAVLRQQPPSLAV